MSTKYIKELNGLFIVSVAYWGKNIKIPLIEQWFVFVEYFVFSA